MTTAMPGRNGAPFTLAAARADTCCDLPVHVNPVWVVPWATRSPTACVVVELTLPASFALQVAVNTTRIAAPLATSVAELTLIAGMLVALADVRAAMAGAAGEVVAASAATGISAAVQTAVASRPISRLGVRTGKYMVFSFRCVRHMPLLGQEIRHRSADSLGNQQDISHPALLGTLVLRSSMLLWKTMAFTASFNLSNHVMRQELRYSTRV
jgi:hypothetical protein